MMNSLTIFPAAFWLLIYLNLMHAAVEYASAFILLGAIAAGWLAITATVRCVTTARGIKDASF